MALISKEKQVWKESCDQIIWQKTGGQLGEHYVSPGSGTTSSNISAPSPSPKAAPSPVSIFPDPLYKTPYPKKTSTKLNATKKRVVGWLSVEIAVSVNHTAGNSVQLDLVVDSVTLRSHRPVCARDINTSCTDRSTSQELWEFITSVLDDVPLHIDIHYKLWAPHPFPWVACVQIIKKRLGMLVISAWKSRKCLVRILLAHW